MRALWTLLVALTAAIVVVIAFGGGATHSRRHPRTSVRPAGPRRGAAVRRPAFSGRLIASSRLSSSQVRGDGVIRKLARLALPVYCAGSRGRALAFTFDDGPGVYTHYAVKKLLQAHEQATFFVVGRSIEAWPGWLARERKVATLGDHTFTHSDLQELPPSTVAWELASDKRLIQRESGQPVDLFRPPYGGQDTAVNRIARQLGLLDIMWSMDSRDSLGANWAEIIKNVKSDLRPGAIILMHENRGQTIRALTTLLPVLHRRHLRSVSLPELFATDPPSIAQVRRGLYACHHPPRMYSPAH
jgi:peptidoglycan/xylan/chitin deacetylase (PgdA/CDA1 family)